MPARVLDVGCGDGQVSRLAGRRGARAGRRHRPDLEPGGRRRASVAVAPIFARGAAAELPFRRRRRSTPWWPASCSSTSPRSTTRSPRSPGCSHPAAGSASSSTIRCCRRRTADGSTTRCSTRRSSTGGSGPYLVEDESIEEVEKDVFIPFIHRPLSRYINALAGQRAVGGTDGRAGAAARFPRPRRGVRGGGDDPAPAVPAHAQAHHRLSGAGRVARGDRHPRDHGFVRGGTLATAATCSRISAGTSSTTCRPRSSRRSSNWPARPGSEIDRLALVAGRQHVGPGRRRSRRSAPPGTACGCCSSRPSTRELVRRYDSTRGATRSTGGRRPGRGDRAGARPARSTGAGRAPISSSTRPTSTSTR